MATLPMAENRITAGFGYYTVNGVRRMHYALDFASKPQNPAVNAAHSGTVIESYYGAAGGNTVALRGAFGGGCDIITRYLHLASRAVVVGANVTEGQKIGVQGNTGTNTTGAHLHFETWIVPKSFVYSGIAARSQYAVDPLALCHTTAAQTLEPNGKTAYFAIPQPEPKIAFEPLDGALCYVGDVEVFYYPSNAYSPIVGGNNREKRYFNHFFAAGRYPALYRAQNNGIGWAGVTTDWGLLWVPLIAGRCSLQPAEKPKPTPEPAPKPEPVPAPEPMPAPKPAPEPTPVGKRSSAQNIIQFVIRITKLLFCIPKRGE